jgi:hypothetical protein
VPEGLRAEIPDELGLDQNYPNPFNGETILRFRLPAAGDVRLCVYDLLGREVATVIEGHRERGEHTALFDASRLASGVYLARIEAAGASIIRKMLLVR